MTQPPALQDLPQLELHAGFAALPEKFYRRVPPTPLPAPHLVALSPALAQALGLEAANFAAPGYIESFCGNRLLPGSQPYAAVYSGHQFGVWAGQLGDGRAHNLGCVHSAAGPLELQLKGAGQTPYSRFADGRAVLRSSIREFLCSEAMAALGVPSTRALCIIGSPAAVRRETTETAAVVTRTAPSFVRFGSFEHWAAQDDSEALRSLADHVIERFYPALRAAPKPYEAWLAEVAQRTGELIAHWQALGFMHGVMNTDNMSILGLTLDYGPFGFMDAFDARHICNHSDSGGRYAYQEQPRVGLWNLYALGAACEALVGPPEAQRAIIDAAYIPAYEAAFARHMRARLGLREALDGDEAFFGETFALLQTQHADYTLFLRTLSELPAAAPATPSADAALRDLCVDREAVDAWLQQWRQRLAREASVDAERVPRMLGANPKYVLRNWIGEEAIRAAQAGDFSRIDTVLRCLTRPFDAQPEFERYAAAPPAWARELELSCSS